MTFDLSDLKQKNDGFEQIVEKLEDFGFKLGGSRYFAKRPSSPGMRVINISEDTDYDFYCGEYHKKILEDLGFVGHNIGADEENPYVDDDAIDVFQHPKYDNIQVVMRKNPRLYTKVLENISTNFFYNFLWKSSPHFSKLAGGLNYLTSRELIQENINMLMKVAADEA